MNLKNLLIIFLTANVLFSQNVVWETEFDFIKSNSSPRGIDLNQDGIEDIVLSGGVDGLPSPYGAMAINGANGEILWTKENGNEWFLSAQHFDQNGDFIPDLLFGGRDAELQLIDGSNGNLIWEFWGNEDNPNDYGWYNFYTFRNKKYVFQITPVGEGFRTVRPQEWILYTLWVGLKICGMKI